MKSIFLFVPKKHKNPSFSCKNQANLEYFIFLFIFIDINFYLIYTTTATPQAHVNRHPSGQIIN